jgi:Ca2+-binding RTX toxin-like protein
LRPAAGERHNFNATDITLTKSGVHLTVNVTATGQQITLDEQYWLATANWGIDRFQFADGTTWNRDQIMQNAWWNGAVGNDSLSGWASYDNIEGGAGNDTLTGGTGNDTFIFRSGFGQDVITDFTPGAASNDVIEFQDDLFANFDAVLAAASTSGANTIIIVDGTTQITLQNVALTVCTLTISDTSEFAIVRRRVAVIQ